jgi:hypothetical protein
MKALVFILTLAVTLFTTAQQAGDHLEDVNGTIKKIGELGYAIVTEGESGTRYAPDNMPEEFEVDGLRVIFSGVVGEIPPNARGGRMWGMPLELTDIRRLEE